MQAVVTCPRGSQQSASNVVQAQHLIQFPEQQQSAIRTDLRAMKFQPHSPVKPQPNIDRSVCTLRVTHEISLQTALTY
jgi:hypothetical protein